MPFQIMPILETMIRFYQQPKTINRFQEYMKILEGGKKGDLKTPIGRFNPMAKEHVLEKLIELKQLNVEVLINETIQQLNAELNNKFQPIIKVAFNLADDLKGAWTNHFTTDYDNKFKLNALVTRNFCTPIFWSNESFSTDLIIERTLEYCYRTIYWQLNKNPKTLAEHILQETMVAQNINIKQPVELDLELMRVFYERNKNSTNYVIIFNFLYGDDATISLGNNPLGIKEPYAGFKFAKWLAQQNN